MHDGASTERSFSMVESVSSRFSLFVWNKRMTAGKSKKVLILELNPGGHHPHIVRLLLDSDLAKFADMVVACPRETLLHPAIAACSVPFQHCPIDIGASGHVTRSSAELMRMQWEIGSLYRKAFVEVSKSAPVDFVIVPYVDNCVLKLAAFRETFDGTPWLALTMRTMLHYRYVGVMAPEQSFATVRRWLLYRILRQKSAVALLTIDPTLAEFATKQRHPRFRKIQYVPDPVVHYHSALPSKAEAKQRLGIPGDARVVLVYGVIDERKGTTFLVKGAAASDCSKQIHVVLAGKNWMPEKFKKSEAFRLLLGQNRIHNFDRFIDDEHEQLLLASADCMWVGYIDFYGSSGVMALAGRHAVPVLASEYGLVGHFTKKHNLGVTIDPQNQASVVAALNRLVAEPEFFVRAGRNGIPVFEDHNPAEFQRAVTDAAQRSWSR
jgi:glycosyltransferase involved in cell wall biosynthesis